MCTRVSVSDSIHFYIIHAVWLAQVKIKPQVQPQAGSLVPHLLLRELSHKNEGGRARVCLDLCKPSPPRKAMEHLPSGCRSASSVLRRAGTSNPWRTKYKVRVTEHLLFLSLLGVISIKKKTKLLCHAGSSAFCTGVTMIYSLKENYLFWRCQG